MIVEERLTTYIDSLNWQIPAGLKEVEKEALADGVPIIRCSMQSLLGFLLRTRKPDAVLEIGTAVGFSAMLMRENLKPDAVLDTIEKVPMRIQAAKQNFEKYNKSASIRLLEGDAKDVLEQLSKNRNNMILFLWMQQKDSICIFCL